MLSPSDTAQLVNAARAGDQRAAEQLLEQNRGLVGLFVARYWARSDAAARMERADLEQEARLGFLAGLRSYDPERGAFATHISWAIRGSLTHALRRRAGDPAADSLDELATEDGSLLLDLIPADGPSPEDVTLARVAGPVVALVALLAPELQQVLQLLYPLDGREPLTCRQVAAVLGIGERTVRSREARALRVLRALLEQQRVPLAA